MSSDDEVLSDEPRNKAAPTLAAFLVSSFRQIVSRLFPSRQLSEGSPGRWRSLGTSMGKLAVCRSSLWAHKPKDRFLRGSGTGLAQNNFGRYHVRHGSFRLEDATCIGPMGAVQSKAKISRGLASRLTATFLKVQKKVMGKPSQKSKHALDSIGAFK